MILIQSVNVLVCDIFYHGALIEFLTSSYPVKITLEPIIPKITTTFVGDVTFQG